MSLYEFKSVCVSSYFSLWPTRYVPLKICWPLQSVNPFNLNLLTSIIDITGLVV
jgi:hypothetical protein